MDVMMPNLNGLDATRQIRASEHESQGPRKPIVGITSYSERPSCLEAGMDDFLSKPVTTEQLRGLVKRWIPASDVQLAPSLSVMFPINDMPPTQSALADKRLSDLRMRLG
jgi:DNA-binding response OmpR family regulator